MIELGIVENALLCLVPVGHRALCASNDHDDVTIVPAVRLRDIPSFLGRRPLCSWTNLSERKQPCANNSRSESSIRMEERNLGDLSNMQQLGKEHGSFFIPNHQSVQIYATGGDEGRYLMIHQKSRLQVSNTCGYVAGDFCGVGGYQQVIWLPRLLVDRRVVWNLDSAKRMLVEILHQSIVADGIHINMSDDAIVERVSDPMGGSCPSIALHAITSLPTDIPTDNHVEEFPTYTHQSTGSTQRSNWATTMARALETRLLCERRERDRRIEEQELQRHLMTQNRMALQQLASPEGNGIEAARMRYHVLPRSGSQSAIVFLEIDVSPMKATHENAIYGLLLSCTLVSRRRNPTAVSVRTHSGIVPELQYGTCVTITAIAEVDGMMLLFAEEADDGVCCLSIEAHWKCTLQNDGRRRADKVADLCLSLESLLLVQEKMKCIALTPLGRKPSAIYECRRPHILKVDVSHCVRSDWNLWAASLNDALQGKGSRIDVSTNQGEISTVSVVVFAFPSEVLPGVWIDVPI